MSPWVLGSLEVIETEQPVAPGDDAHFVVIHGAGGSGCYGPVSERIGRYVRDTLAAEVEGARISDHAGLLNRLRTVARTAPSDIASWAVGTVDCAAWDLHGRLASRSVAGLLARAEPRSTVPAYASWLSQNLTSIENLDLLRDVAADGWRFTKWGLRRDPAESPGQAAARMARAVERASQSLGSPLAVDAVGTWTPSVSLAFAQSCDPSCLLWLEDPLPQHDLDMYELLAATQVPLAVGERAHCDEDPMGLIQYVRPTALTLDVVGCGGLTRATQILAVARSQDIPIYPHGRSLLPGLHLAAAFPDAVPAVEYRLQWEPGRQRLYDESLQPEDGHIRLPDSPGLGTTPRRTACPAQR
ncbi:enolase C-terminal domain-like protein [Streptomyces griseus]|uniref:Enolase C-terminal domain-like protein n=1 Tax=Streptomyces stephensoniae TaxID=3375367 RepID=A0ABU2W5K3_9ACTN|nr:enolase C-terminal domain-like protein [Streptomyces griseus]MDT0493146.1 enolase C-terminal domain-like protein [Streptomyces griseus]